MQHVARLPRQELPKAPPACQRQRDRRRRTAATERQGVADPYDTRFGRPTSSTEDNRRMALRLEILPEAAYIFLDATWTAHVVVEDEADLHAAGLIASRMGVLFQPIFVVEGEIKVGIADVDFEIVGAVIAGAV